MQQQSTRPSGAEPSLRTVRRLWSITFGTLFLLACALGIVDNFVLFRFGIGLSLTTYGMLVTTHSVTQHIRALFNYFGIGKQRRKAIKAEERGEFSFPFIVASYGHQENLDYYEKNLRSVKAQSHDRDFKGAWFVVDGDATRPGNSEMRILFDQIFGDEGFSISLTEIDPSFDQPYEYLSDYQRQYIVDMLVAIKENNPKVKYICILQAHGGKREIMYLAMDAAIRVDSTIEGIGATDSDTVIDRNAYPELKRIFFENPEVGGVTGDVGISNLGRKNGGTLLTRLSAIRYWNAFNIERASQSASRAVACMSGPLYMVRVAAIWHMREGIRNMDRWKHNRFMGMGDTFGDDRGLTEVLLEDGWETMYTHKAKCVTETPPTLKRFYPQQVRWNKSANREAARTFRAFFAGLLAHPAWVIYDLIYQTFFPILLMIGIIFQLSLVFTERSLLPIVSLFATVFLTGLVRGVISAVISRDPWKVLNCLYGFVFLFVLLPARIDAVIHLWDPAWGTPPRAGLNEGGAGGLFWIMTLPFRLVQAIFGFFWRLTPAGRNPVESTENEDSSLMQ